MDALQLVNYSEKSVALLIEKDGIITEELEMIGGKYNYRLSCGPGWIFSRKKSYERLIGLFEAYDIAYDIRDLTDLEKRETGKSGANKQEYIINATLDLVKYAESIEEYNPSEFAKEYPIVVKLSGGELVPIFKHSLKSEFWFPDEDHDEEIAQAKTEEYFIAENTEKYDHMIAAIKGEASERKYIWLANWYTGNKNRWSIDRSQVCPEATNAIKVLDDRERELAEKGLYKPLSEEDKQRLLTGYELAKEAQIRRCQTWLKRYGINKISVRTYWANR